MRKLYDENPPIKISIAPDHMTINLDLPEAMRAAIVEILEKFYTPVDVFQVHGVPCVMVYEPKEVLFNIMYDLTWNYDVELS